MNFKCIIPMAIIGFICIITGMTVLFGYMPKLIHNKIADEFYIHNNSDAFDRWQKLPVPLQWTMYFFNITNPDDFDGKEVNSYQFEQVGPYVYEEQRVKEDVEFTKDGSNATYVEKKTFVFKPELSKGNSADDVIYIPNLFHGLNQTNIDMFLKGNPDPRLLAPTLHETVQNLAFDGIDFLSKSLFGPQLNNYASATVNTGKNDIDDVLQLEKYDGFDYFLNSQSNGPVWLPKGECNTLKGTDGTQLKPGLVGDEKLWVYEQTLCRSLVVENKPLNNIEVKGISTLRYVVQDRNFAHSEENRCFCLEDNEDKCDVGLLNIRNCPSAQDVEILVSPPFYYTNRKLLNKTGLARVLRSIDDSNVANYGTILDVEPNTGLVLKAHKRLQLNLKLRKNAVPILKDLTDDLGWGFQVAPIMWLDESAEIDQKNVDKLNDELFSQKKLFTGLLISLTTVGFVLLAVSGVCIFCQRRADKTQTNGNGFFKH